MKNFIKTTDQETARKLSECGFQLVSQAGDIYTFLNRLPNNFNFDNIDKILVSENNLYFSRGNDTQRFKLTDDGIVEKYLK